MFDKNLLGNKYTWHGKSRKDKGDRIPFKIFTNIIKLIQSVMVYFIPSTTLNTIEQLFVNNIIRFAAIRAKEKGERISIGRKPFKRIKKIYDHKIENGFGEDQNEDSDDFEDNEETDDET